MKVKANENLTVSIYGASYNDLLDLVEKVQERVFEDKGKGPMMRQCNMIDNLLKLNKNDEKGTSNPDTAIATRRKNSSDAVDTQKVQ